MAHRQVRLSARFLAESKRLYPPGGAADGRPAFELFESGPLAGAKFQFSRQFDELPSAVQGVAVKFVVTHQVPIFPAMVFFAILGTDGVVELIDVDVDEGYFDLVADDPSD